MEGQDRNATDHLVLIDELQRAPHKFGFFAAVRRIDCLFRSRARVGEASRPADEPVRLAQEPSLTFAPATLASFDRGNATRPGRLSVYFLGLFGPNGPLPLHLTEYARDRMRNFRDYAFARFADVFHHRMLSLFYRAWANAQPTAQLDDERRERFSTYVGALGGMGMETVRRRDAMPDFAKLYFVGRFGTHARNAEGLAAIIGGFYRMPSALQEFVGEWLDIPEASKWRLGESPENGSLGETVTLGGRVWSVQHKFRIRVGPVSFEDYCRLLPGRDDLRLMVAIVRNYVGDALSWDVNLVLRADAVPPARLDGSTQLGWTSWLHARTPSNDLDDLILNPMAFAALAGGRRPDTRG